MCSVFASRHWLLHSSAISLRATHIYVPLFHTVEPLMLFPPHICNVIFKIKHLVYCFFFNIFNVTWCIKKKFGFHSWQGAGTTQSTCITRRLKNLKMQTKGGLQCGAGEGMKTHHGECWSCLEKLRSILFLCFLQKWFLYIIRSGNHVGWHQSTFHLHQTGNKDRGAIYHRFIATSAATGQIHKWRFWSGRHLATAARELSMGSIWVFTALDSLLPHLPATCIWLKGLWQNLLPFLGYRMGSIWGSDTRAGKEAVRSNTNTSANSRDGSATWTHQCKSFHHCQQRIVFGIKV